MTKQLLAKIGFIILWFSQQVGVILLSLKNQLMDKNILKRLSVVSNQFGLSQNFIWIKMLPNIKVFWYLKFIKKDIRQMVWVQYFLLVRK